MQGPKFYNNVVSQYHDLFWAPWKIVRKSITKIINNRDSVVTPVLKLWPQNLQCGIPAPPLMMILLRIQKLEKSLEKRGQKQLRNSVYSDILLYIEGQSRPKAMFLNLNSIWSNEVMIVKFWPFGKIWLIRKPWWLIKNRVVFEKDTLSSGNLDCVFISASA